MRLDDASVVCAKHRARHPRFVERLLREVTRFLAQPAPVNGFLERSAKNQNTRTSAAPKATICHSAHPQAAPIHAATQTQAAVVDQRADRKQVLRLIPQNTKKHSKRRGAGALQLDYL